MYTYNKKKILDEMIRAFEQTIHALSGDPAGLDAAIEEALFPSRIRAARWLVNDTLGTVRETTVAEELVAQLADNRENVALLDEQREITHGQLDEMARIIAARVSEHGTAPDELIAVCMEK